MKSIDWPPRILVYSDSEEKSYAFFSHSPPICRGGQPFDASNRAEVLDVTRTRNGYADDARFRRPGHLDI